MRTLVPANRDSSGHKAVHPTRPIRILEFHCATEAAAAQKRPSCSAREANPQRFAITVCYLRSVRDDAFDIDRRAHDLGVDFTAITQRNRFDPAIWSRVRQLVRNRRIDIVHSHDYKTNLIALMLGRTEGIIPLSTVHGYTGHSWLERCVYYPADRRLLKRFPLVVAVSSNLREALIRVGCSSDASAQF